MIDLSSPQICYCSGHSYPRTGDSFGALRNPGHEIKLETTSQPERKKEKRRRMECKSGITTYRLVAPMAVGRLDGCLQWNIIKGWHILKKKAKSTQAAQICLIRRTFHLHKIRQNCSTRHVFWAKNIRKMCLPLHPSSHYELKSLY